MTEIRLSWPGVHGMPPTTLTVTYPRALTAAELRTLANTVARIEAMREYVAATG